MTSEKYAVTVLITVYNESKNLKELLPLLTPWVKEVLVVDSFSTDDSVAVAEALGAKVLQHVYESPGAQKNWAIPQASEDWILIMDADERPKPALIAELQEFLLHKRDKVEESAFRIGFENYFLKKRIYHSGWSGDSAIRFIKKANCRYNNNFVHEEIDDSQIKVGRMQNKFEHYTYVSLDHFIDKLQRYSTWGAIDYAKKTPKVGYFHLYLKPCFRFFKHFILQKGFLDGKVGFIISVLMAFGVFLRYAKIQEAQILEKHKA